MTNITIPIQEEYLDVIDSEVKNGDYDSRSQFVRNAIKMAIQAKEESEILHASKLAHMGEVFSGDIDKLAKEHA
jgi:Arc/MetJ-type ribon-helix-helix transcriptional regulator